MGKKSDSRFWCKIKNYIAPIGFVVTLIIILTVNLFVHGARKIGQRGVFGRTAVREVPDS